MAQYATAQICLNGHLITGDCEGNPESCGNFCESCSAATIKACPNCDTPIRGYSRTHEPSGRVVIGSDFNPPNFCRECRSAFPWYKAWYQIVHNLPDEECELSETKKTEIREYLPHLANKTSKTKEIVARIKDITPNLSPKMVKNLNDIFVKVATDVVKEMLGLK